METGTVQVENNLALMQELLSCGNNIPLWQYDAEGKLISTNARHLVLDRIFEGTGNKEYMVEFGRKHRLPLMLGGNLGLMWCAVFWHKENRLHAIYLLGPVYNTEISQKTIEESIRDHNIDLSWRKAYLELMGSLPVVSSILFFQYALMLHYCVSGEKLSRSDIQYRDLKPAGLEPFEDSVEKTPKQDRMHTWLAERALLKMIREGDLNYQNAIDKAAYLSNGVRSGEQNPLLHAMVSCCSFTSLCVREAIEAGISPETAYSTGDSYIQSMVAAKDISELSAISHAMYEDFIRRVHKHRTDPKVSPYIQACRDYIELHTEETLSLPILASRVGYSESHLSRKFKQEMGVSISTYIRYVRVERSKFYLSDTSMRISQIAAILHFCSSSHFSNAFQEVTGMTPQQFRQAHQKI